MSDSLTITIDGRKCKCQSGEYLCDIAQRNGIFIPTLCRNDAFADHRACCRICVVEVEERGRKKVVTACVYPVKSEIKVFTNSDKIKEERAVVMALLAKRAPESDVINNMANAMGGSDKEGFSGLAKLDSGKCILCGLCVQACDSIGSGAISTVNRGTDKMVNTPYGKENNSCIGCLSCANVCPTGAIEFTENSKSRTIWNKKFDLVKCDECGKVIGTKQQVDHATEKFVYESGLLCEECKRQREAAKLKETYLKQR